MPTRDLDAEAIVNLSLRGYGAQRIATYLNMPLKDVLRTIKDEFAVPPGQISDAFRAPTVNTPPSRDEVLDTFIPMHAHGSTIAEIAAETGYAASTVASSMRKLGAEVMSPSRSWSLDDYDYLLAHTDDSWTDTARHLGRSRQQVKHRYTMLRNMGFPIPQKRRRRTCSANTSIAS